MGNKEFGKFFSGHYNASEDGFLLAGGNREELLEHAGRDRRTASLLSRTLSAVDRARCIADFEFSDYEKAMRLILLPGSCAGTLKELEKYMAEGEIAINGGFNIMKLGLEYLGKEKLSANFYRCPSLRYSDGLFTGKYALQFSILFNDFYDAKFLNVTGSRRWWEDMKLNTGARFSVNPLAFSVWEGLIGTLAEEGRSFLHDLVKEMEGFKDFPEYRTVCQIPVELKRLEHISSKKEFLEKFTGRGPRKVRRIFRRMPCLLAYSLMKTETGYQPVLEECLEFPGEILRSFSEAQGSGMTVREKDRAFYLIKAILKARYRRQGIPFDGEGEINGHILNDTLNMIGDLKNIRWRKVLNFSGLQKYHDELVKKTLMEKAERIPDTEWKVPGEFRLLKKEVERHNGYKPEFSIEFISSRRRLYIEGQSQSSCVYSYRDSIQAGRCAVLSCQYEGRRYTAEIVRGDGRYSAVQFTGKYNSMTDIEKPLAELKKFLAKVNQEA